MSCNSFRNSPTLCLHLFMKKLFEIISDVSSSFHFVCWFNEVLDKERNKLEEEREIESNKATKKTNDVKLQSQYLFQSNQIPI